MYGINNDDLKAFADKLQMEAIHAAFEKTVRENHAGRYQNVEIALEKRNGEYIDGEVSEWFEHFAAGYMYPGRILFNVFEDRCTSFDCGRNRIRA